MAPTSTCKHVSQELASLAHVSLYKFVFTAPIRTSLILHLHPNLLSLWRGVHEGFAKGHRTPKQLLRFAQSTANLGRPAPRDGNVCLTAIPKSPNRPTSQSPCTEVVNVSYFRAFLLTKLLEYALSQVVLYVHATSSPSLRGGHVVWRMCNQVA
jgi:hypothetical protein